MLDRSGTRLAAFARRPLAAMVAGAAVFGLLAFALWWTSSLDTGPPPVAEAPAPIAPAPPVEHQPLPSVEHQPIPPSPPPQPPAERVKALFAAADVPYPPRSVLLAAFKDERQLELYARARRGTWRLVQRYPILGASGGPGPKLVEGDRQVPEGVYSVTFLNPNSKFHLSMRLDYPNRFDREMAKKDKRTILGGDIMIHGGIGSTGCLAMGDPAIEELYTLAGAVRLRDIKVVIAPFDLRTRPRDTLPAKPDWLAKLYDQIGGELGKLPAASSL